MKDGEGIFLWADGSSYHGGFSGNNIQGKGQYRYLFIKLTIIKNLFLKLER